MTEHSESAKHGYLKVLGHYNPITKELQFNQEEANEYLKNGAKLSPTLEKILKVSSK